MKGVWCPRPQIRLQPFPIMKSFLNVQQTNNMVIAMLRSGVISNKDFMRTEFENPRPSQQIFKNYFSQMFLQHHVLKVPVWTTLL